MNNEVWKTYPEFPWIQGSSLGGVRTIDRMVRNGKGKRIVKGRILKQSHDKDGYLHVKFSVNGKTVNRKAHRIIASCFIPNPGNLPQINHENCDRTDNNVSNLEWCDASYNARYREKYGISNEETLGFPVFVVNLTTLEVSCFRSQSEAGRQLGINQSSVAEVIAGKLKQVGGFWFTEDDGKGIKIDKDKLREIKAGMEYRGNIFAVNLKTQEVLRFRSQSEASRMLGVYQSNINAVIKGKYKQTGGFWFTNADDNAVGLTRNKFGDVVADKIEELMNDKETQLA